MKSVQLILKDGKVSMEFFFFATLEILLFLSCRPIFHLKFYRKGGKEERRKGGKEERRKRGKRGKEEKRKRGKESSR